MCQCCLPHAPYVSCSCEWARCIISLEPPSSQRFSTMQSRATKSRHLDTFSNPALLGRLLGSQHLWQSVRAFSQLKQILGQADQVTFQLDLFNSYGKGKTWINHNHSINRLITLRRFDWQNCHRPKDVDIAALFGWFAIWRVVEDFWHLLEDWPIFTQHTIPWSETTYNSCMCVCAGDASLRSLFLTHDSFYL